MNYWGKLNELELLLLRVMGEHNLSEVRTLTVVELCMGYFGVSRRTAERYSRDMVDRSGCLFCVGGSVIRK